MTDSAAQRGLPCWSLAIALASFAAPLQAAVLDVPVPYSTIQEAINDAESGDVVRVDIGTYSVNLDLRSDVDVWAIETARTFLIARDDTLPTVSANSISNVLLSNFTFIASTDGVAVIDSTSIIIASNVFDGLDGAAVAVDATSSADIDNNVFWNNATAIDRIVAAADITNNIFANNTVTIVSTGLNPTGGITSNCFFNNDDLKDSGSDTGLGDTPTIENPRFVSTGNRDFHLMEKDPPACIDAGTGIDDVIDDTTADTGAYGGGFADPFPFPVARPDASDASTPIDNPTQFNIAMSWAANEAYLVTNSTNPGTYRVWYQLNQPGPPYDLGDDATNGNSGFSVSANVTNVTLTDLQPTVQTPGAPGSLSAGPQNQSVVLNWGAASGATGYIVHYGVADVNENNVSVGNTTSYTVTGLTNGTTYQFTVSGIGQPIYYLAVTAVDNTGKTDPDDHESGYSEERSIAIGDQVEGPQTSAVDATPEEVEPYPNLPDQGGCFVATAAFGADWHAEVQVLRDFRDRYLLTNPTGSRFVDWYYRNGPGAAAWLDNHAGFKPLVRAALWPLVALAAFLLGASGPVMWATALLLISLIVLVWRSRRTAPAGECR